MTTINFRSADKAGLLAGTALVTALSGCLTEPATPRGVYHGRPAGQVQAVVAYQYQDDYDYFPGYETYYNRSRREYVYREGRTWVRRPEPRGVTVQVLLAAPSVRLDFRDSPEQHHSSVVKSYPRNWTPPGQRRTDSDDRRVEIRNDARDESRTVQVALVIQDDYDYFPGYETYYSRNRREYVYREGSAWVRRPEPRGVTVQVLLAAPSVRLDFHDSPEQHHSSVVKSYPRNWTPPGKAKGHDDKRHDDRRNE